MALLKRPEKPKRNRMKVLASAAGGAVVAYFLDPDRGRARRARTRDRIAGAVRRSRRRAERMGRRVGADVHGVAQKARHLRTEPKDYSDQTLAEKVKTELYREPDVDRGRVLVNVEEGRVVLRGEARTPDQIKGLEKLVRGVPGVEDVENLLHLPKTPAPNKASARAVEARPERPAG